MQSPNDSFPSNKNFWSFQQFNVIILLRFGDNLQEQNVQEK